MTSDPRPFWRRRLLKPALALAALNAALFAVYTLPRLMQARSLESRRRTLQAVVERERARLAVAQARADAIRFNEHDTRRFYEDVVGNRENTLLPLLRRIAEIATELGLETERSSYQPVEVKGVPLERLVITQPVTGTYREVVSFLAQLERLPQFVTVDRLSIRGPSGPEGPTALDLTLSAYFRVKAGAT